MKGVGLAIGLQAETPDIFPQLASIAADKQRRYAEAQERKKQQIQKQKDLGLEQLTEETKVDLSKFDRHQYEDVNNIKNGMMSKAIEAYNDSTTPQEMVYKTSKVFQEANAKLQGMMVTAEQLKKLNDSKDIQLTPYSLYAKQVYANTKNMDDMGKGLSAIHDPTKSFHYDPDQEAFSLNYLNDKVPEYDKLFNEAAGKVNMVKQVPTGSIAGHETAVNAPFDTQAEAEAYTKRFPGIGQVNSVESVSNQAAQADPDSYRYYIMNIASTNPANIDENGNLDMKKVNAQWQDYVYNGVKSRVKREVKDISIPKYTVNVGGDKEKVGELTPQSSTDVVNTDEVRGQQTSPYTISYVSDKKIAIPANTIGINSNTGISGILPAAADVSTSNIKIVYVKPSDKPQTGFMGAAGFRTGKSYYRKLTNEELADPVKRAEAIAIPVIGVQYPKSEGTPAQKNPITGEIISGSEGDKSYTEYQIPLKDVTGALISSASKENLSAIQAVIHKFTKLSNKENEGLDRNSDLYKKYDQDFRIEGGEESIPEKSTGFNFQ